MRLLLAVLIAGSISGCGVGSLTDRTQKVNVDGTECVKITSPDGVGIDCDWEDR